MNKKEIEKDSILHIRISSEKLDRYRIQAEAEGRSLSNWVEWHLDPIAGQEPKTPISDLLYEPPNRKDTISLEQLRKNLGLKKLKKPRKAAKKMKGSRSRPA